MHKILVVIFMMIFSSPAFAAPKKLRVLIDAGHGGEDNGATRNGVVEKNLVLAVSLELARILKKDARFETILTRQTDQFLSLEQRSQKAEQSKADVFVSIHANSSQVESARGTEIYFENQIPTDEESMLLAARENNIKAPKEIEDKTENADLNNILGDLQHSRHMILSSVLSQEILESFQRDLKVRTRSIRQAPFHVLSVSMPATLIELGFITNPKEAGWLKEPATHTKFAESIKRGLVQYKEKLDKTPSKP